MKDFRNVYPIHAGTLRTKVVQVCPTWPQIIYIVYTRGATAIERWTPCSFMDFQNGS